MSISIEIKKQEAIQRMKALGIFSQTIKQFKSGLVSYSEPPMGANYWVDDDQKKIIKEFEEENNALVYFVIRSYTEFGKLDAFLYVSDYEEEWEMDRADISDDYAVAYVYNYDIPEYSEIGSIGVQNRFGGLVRVS
jgi:hypothetical protein